MMGRIESLVDDTMPELVPEVPDDPAAAPPEEPDISKEKAKPGINAEKVRDLSKWLKSLQSKHQSLDVAEKVAEHRDMKYLAWASLGEVSAQVMFHGFARIAWTG